MDVLDSKGAVPGNQVGSWFRARGLQIFEL